MNRIITGALLLAALLTVPAAGAGAAQPRWAIGVTKTVELAHQAAEREVARDDELVGYQRPDCHHTRLNSGRVNYSEVRCAVAMRVDGGGFRDYEFRRWSTYNASGRPVTWTSFGPRPAYATGLVLTGA